MIGILTSDHINVYKLLVLDRNTWNYTNVSKQMVIDTKVQFKKVKNMKYNWALKFALLQLSSYNTTFGIK